MKPFRVWFVAPVLATFALLSVATIGSAQSTDERSVAERAAAERAAAEPSKDAHTHLVTDWSHRHLIFSHAEARAKSNSPEDRRLQGDIRFQQELARRRGAAARSSVAMPTEAERRERRSPFDPKVPVSDGALERDWTAALGQSANFGTVGDGQYPAKFNFDLPGSTIGASSCTGATSDFVVYNTNTVSFIAPTGSTGGGTVRDARDIGIFLGAPGCRFQDYYHAARRDTCGFHRGRRHSRRTAVLRRQPCHGSELSGDRDRQLRGGSRRRDRNFPLHRDAAEFLWLH